MTPLRTLIVDDESLARRKIRNWLIDDENIEIVTECSNGFDALEVLTREQIDLLFLDIEMPLLNGFEMLYRLPPEQMPLVVFVTAHNQHAIEAFKLHALDYLLKPFDRERFETTLRRAKKQAAQATNIEIRKQVAALFDTAKIEVRYQERFTIKNNGRVRLIPAARVDWIEADGNYVKLHCGPETHLVRDSVGRLEHKLDPQNFPRIHRSTIVNIERIHELHAISHGDYQVLLKDGTKLSLSRNYRKKLAEKLRLDI